MDKTETYIKMCEKAVEIQKKWKPAEADFMYNFAVEIVSFIRVNRTTDRRFKNHSIPYNKDRFFWLPRQDQLQEMENPKGFSGFIDWRGWLDNIYPAQENPFDAEAVRFHSWEQLWLAFIMSELYSKHWNGEEWIT